MTDVIVVVADLIVILLYVMVALKFELQMQQQNSYRNSRYLKWLKGDITRPGKVVNVILAVVLICFSHSIVLLNIAAFVSLFCLITELRKKYKKPLVFTARAKRLYTTSIIIVVAISIAVFYVANNIQVVANVLFVLAVLSFLVIMLANILTQPVEKLINRWYWRDAKRIISSMPNLKIIGITGSYGKTSTKHYLYRILSTDYNVVMTPGSFNTTLGVIKTIRENIKPFHEIFIVEMGAKQIGDIREICDLVNPQIGIITAVGEQHLESFKSIQNVQRAKFELIDALPQSGLAILNNDFEFVASRKVDNVDNVIRYATEGNVLSTVDYYIENVKYNASQTTFSIVGGGLHLELTTKLVGSCNLSNIMAGVIVAHKLGLSEESIKLGVAAIEQVEHRLNIKRTTSGITIIDDAFNSNPHGAKMALDVLKSFTQGKRVIITPGLIELGSKQYDYNQTFGMQISYSCDYAIVVGEYNRAPIVSGLEKAGFAGDKIFLAPTFKDATAHLAGIVKSGDTVLYENDLPDTFR